MNKTFEKRFPGLYRHVVDARNPAYAPTEPPAIEPTRPEPTRAWHADFDAAMKRRMARPAMYGCDPFTDSTIDAALMACEMDTAPVLRGLRRPEPCACGIRGPVITPLTAIGRWWLAFKRFW
jgi:hypothetical protein